MMMLLFFRPVRHFFYRYWYRYYPLAVLALEEVVEGSVLHPGGPTIGLAKGSVPYAPTPAGTVV